MIQESTVWGIGLFAIIYYLHHHFIFKYASTYLIIPSSIKTSPSKEWSSFTILPPLMRRREGAFCNKNYMKIKTKHKSANQAVDLFAIHYNTKHD